MITEKVEFFSSNIFVLKSHTNKEVILMSKASIYFTVDNVNGKHDTKELKRELDTLIGVSSVSINDKTESIAVDFHTMKVSQEQLSKKIKKLGYQITDIRLETDFI